MGAGVIGFILGALVGALTGTEIGALVGGLGGAVIGLTVHALIWMRDHLGSDATVERHQVMCTPFGQAADCDFVGDLQTGRWYDVKRCSLLGSDADVDCDKGCVRLMTLSHERPGRCRDCHAD